MLNSSRHNGYGCNMNERIPPSWPVRTYFAPAGRDKSDDFQRKVKIVEKNPLIQEVLNAMSNMVLVLNANRQIVAANEAVLQILNVALNDVLEKRPGESVGCIRAKEGPDGCGTSPHCITCGAVNAILESQKHNAKIVRECSILVEGPSGISSMELKVTASPIIVEGEPFIIAAIEDVSQSKRLAVLQRVFFHDVMNTAVCISGYTNYLKKDPKSIEDTCKLLRYLSDELIDEIKAQRDLLAAEYGDLKIQVEPVNIPQLLEELQLKYLKNPVAEERKVELVGVWDGTIITDKRLLGRVLSNMLKNALEATAPGKTVTVTCSEQGESVAFTVHNLEVMPINVQLQIFQRSFSTKDELGRGIGTYSIKLLGEQYLGGKVTFSSREPDGTSFVLTIPKIIRSHPKVSSLS
jgi:nitrogen-specific signal transduction histidine kinase